MCGSGAQLQWVGGIEFNCKVASQDPVYLKIKHKNSSVISMCFISCEMIGTQWIKVCDGSFLPNKTKQNVQIQK